MTCRALRFPSAIIILTQSSYFIFSNPRAFQGLAEELARAPTLSSNVRRNILGGELVVVVFSSTDCPIANAMAPDIERASVETTEAGGRFYLVHARTDLPDERTRAHASRYKLSMPVIVDRSHTLVKMLGATVTPEAFVLRIDENGGHTVLYQGSVNNLYGSVGNRRVNVTEHHLRDAIRSAAAGEAVDPSRRTPFGCFIERN